MIPEATELMPDLEKKTILAKARLFDPLTHLEDLTERFPSAIQLLRIGGVHPTENTSMDNPYTGESDNESFTNIGEHCFAVACAAEVIAIKLQEAGLLKEGKVTQVVSRSLVHDANKRIEIFRRKAVKAGVIDEAYSPKAYETIKPILEAQGVNQELVAYMAEAGKETGHLSIRDFLTLQDGIPSLVSGRLVDKIIHLADDTTSTSIPQKGERSLTVYLTPWEKMVTSDFPKRYPFLWTEGLAFDTQGEVVIVQDIEAADRALRWVRPYAYWQPFVSNEICREIQSIIDPSNPLKPEYFVKDLVNTILAPTD